MTAALAKSRVLGVPVSPLSEQDVLTSIVTAVRSRTQIGILAVNPEKVIRAQTDRALRECLESAQILIPDGIGVVLALRWLGLARVRRVAGADLMVAICELAEREGYPVFLLGASEETSERALLQLQRRYPKLKIAGRANGYADLRDEQAACERIRASGAKILFVALGSPSQERWIARNATKLPVNVIQGVGGTLDVLAGSVRRAPKLWRSVGLEWLYRLLAQPSRIKRQSALPLFAWRVLLARFTRDLDDQTPRSAESGSL
jgi:N-acetylglucosaminyldiphosphoundecaprenol N-acetyl-beta-D-mannosaminyltransferase